MVHPLNFLFPIPVFGLAFVTSGPADTVAINRVSKEETTAYITKHLAVKAPGEIFTQATGGVIHEYCEGVHRKVNKVATACLMAAPRQNQKLVDDNLVRVVIESEFER